MNQLNVGRGDVVRLVDRSGRARNRRARSIGGFEGLERFEARTLMDAVFWDGGAGTSSWHDAANWNRGGVDMVPQNGDDVTISVASNPTVTFSTGTVTLNSLTTDEALTVSGGTLGLTGTADVNATLNVMGGTLSGGSWDVTGGSLHATTSGGVLMNTQFTGDLLVDTTSASIRVSGTTRFTAARLVANNATLQFTPGYTLMDLVVAEGAATGARNIVGAVGGTGTLTVAPSAVIRLATGVGGGLNIGNSSALTLINNGLISAEAAGRTLSLNNTTVTNNATMQVTAGTLDVSPTNLTNVGSLTSTDAAMIVGGVWTSPGTISATNSALTLQGTYPDAGTVTAVNSTVNLGGNLTTPGLAAFSRTGGTVNLTGTLNNAGSTLTFDATIGPWNFMGGTVTGGTVVFNGANRLIPTTSGGTLTDVQVNGELVLDATSVRVLVGGTTRFTAARLTANNATLQCAPGYTLMDLVVAEGATTGARTIVGAVGGTGTLTIAPGSVIRLAAGSGGGLNIGNSSALTLINNGLISAEAAGRSLSFNNTTVTNNATIQVSDGTLDISPTNWTNAGTITATGGTLTTGGTWSSSGTISETNATVNLGGTFSAAAFSLARSGGTINLTGTMDNTGHTLTFDAASGPWNFMGGTITGGTVVFNGANRLVPTTTGGTLTDVQVNGDLVLDATSVRVLVGGTTRFTAARLTANNATLQCAPGYTLMDLVVAEGAATGARVITGAVGGTGTLTVAPGGVIRLAAGSGGGLNISNSSAATVINNGLITAEANGRTLQFNTTTLANNAMIQVSDGTLDISPANWTNAGTIAATGGTLTTGGTWSSNGTITETNATVNLGGTFSSTGFSLTRSGGTVNLTGTMNNAANTLTFNAASGPWNFMGGTINDGTLVFNGGDRLVMTTSGGTFNSVQVNGDLLFDATSVRALLSGTTRFGTARLTANNAGIQFAPGYTLMDVVVAEGPLAGTRVVTGAVGASGTLTIAPTGVIRLAAGCGSNLTINDSSLLTLVNQGLISAEGTGRTLTINSDVLTNDGTIQALAGTLTISNSVMVTNLSDTTITGGNWIASGTAVFNMPAGTVIETNEAGLGVGAATSFPALTTLSTNNGTLTTSGGGTYTITPAGGTFNNNGTIVLGPTNVLNITGNFTQAAAAVTHVQIQGTAPTDIGRLTVAGTATLNGNVTVTAENGYDPGCVNSVFLSAGTVVGEYATRTLPPVAGHQSLIVYIGNEARFAISPPSDFNRDGVLNSQDLFDFLVAFFNNNVDFNNDGMTNSQDFFDFLTNFFEGCP